ncbi:MAG: hypothetical protein KDJ29_00755 [Hyphomicrobiales bacterium]|nr:hypothetical protein [Hyphomicrobiales bacterium]
MRDTMTILKPVCLIVDDRNFVFMMPAQRRQVTPAIRAALLENEAGSDDWRAHVPADADRQPEVEIGPFSIDEMSTDKDGFRHVTFSRRANVTLHTRGRDASFSYFEGFKRFSPNRSVWVSPKIFDLAAKAGIAHLTPIGGRNFHYFAEASSLPHVDLGFAPAPETRQLGDDTEDEAA